MIKHSRVIKVNKLYITLKPKHQEQYTEQQQAQQQAYLQAQQQAYLQAHIPVSPQTSSQAYSPTSPDNSKIINKKPVEGSALLLQLLAEFEDDYDDTQSIPTSSIPTSSIPTSSIPTSSIPTQKSQDKKPEEICKLDKSQHTSQHSLQQTYQQKPYTASDIAQIPQQTQTHNQHINQQSTPRLTTLSEEELLKMLNPFLNSNTDDNKNTFGGFK